MNIFEPYAISRVKEKKINRLKVLLVEKNLTSKRLV